MLKVSAGVAIFALVVPTILAASVHLLDGSPNKQTAEDILDAVEDYGEISETGLITNCNLSYACFENKHYYFESKKKRTRDRAAKFCRSINMQLISVDDCSKNTFVTNMIKDNDCYRRNYWISGYRTATETWFWGNGNDFNYTNWKSAEPSYGKNQYCVVYRKNYVQWSDEVCSNTNYFICESNNSCT